MNRFIARGAAALALALGFAASAQAIPVTVNMTADNVIASGGLCFAATCTNGIGWSSLGPMSNASDWRQSDSVVLDLGTGTHYFAWNVTNSGSPSSGNPAALLAEILWDGQASYSSSGWEVYDAVTGAFIASATEYGGNGGANIWTSANGGPIGGIGASANWIYSANNFSSADASVWIRTSITIARTTVPEPGIIGLLATGLLFAGAGGRRKRR